ncbi:aminotransferase class IV [Phenylobacterium sp.]|uniref:aminotransferase class IV n=1 Tax=Phenylobacterium sp. TaxID=1871053 RepID=UPI003983275D
MIGPDDRGFTLGDGLFETVLAEAGALRWLDAHLERMTAGCAVLGLPAPGRGAAERLMTAALAEAGVTKVRAAVRLTLSAGPGGRGLERPAVLSPTLVATAAAAPLSAGPARLITATVRRNDRSPASRLKTLSYLDNILARAEAVAAGGDEALMLNTRGQVACAAAANVFWVTEAQLFTPALDCGVLAGTARARLLEAAATMGRPVQEVRVGPEALAGAEGIFLTSSLAGARWAETLDGRPVGPGGQAAALVESLS